MTSAYILTFIGEDRPGLVDQLSQAIEAHQGNWHESRLSQLAGKFAGLVLVSLPAANADALEAELRELASCGLDIKVTPAEAGWHSSDNRAIALSILGPDRLGIVHEISHALAERQINVVEMDSRVESAPMSGEPLFRARIDARIPTDVDLTELGVTLDEIAEQMTLEIDLEQAG